MSRTMKENVQAFAVKQVLKDGYRTVDIMSEGQTLVGTTKMGDLIAERI